MTKLYEYQKEGIQQIEHFNGRVLLADDMGLGKAQPLTAKILTSEGWIKMSDAKKGIHVFGSDGKTHRITGVFPQGEMKVFRVTFSDGSHTECTKEHLWSVNTPSRKYHNLLPRIQTLESFKDDLIKPNGNKNYFIPIVQPLQFPKRELPLDPYLLGVLLGDGGLKYGVQLSNPESDIIARVQSKLPKNMVMHHISRCDYRITKAGKRSSKPNPIKQFLKRFKLNVGSSDKYIPRIYKYASIAQRTAILQGLLDTDGYVSKKQKRNGSPTVQYVTSSKRLCRDVKFIIQSLGGKATLSTYIPTYTYKGERKKGKRAYQLYISFGPGIIPFLCKKKAERYRPKTKYLPTRAIVNVEYIGKKECQCISIDSPDHLYVTDDCILTHNTIQVLVYLKRHPEIRPAIIVCPACIKWVWQEQARKHCHLDTTIVTGKPRYPNQAIPKSPIIIINYDVLYAWKDAITAREPKIIIGDEVQAIKTRPIFNKRTKKWSCQRTKAFIDICKGVEHVVAISGTPLTNRPLELFTTLNILYPKEFPYWTQYALHYCRMKKNRWAMRGFEFYGARHLSELHRRMKKLGMIRRLKEDVLKDLPAKTRIVVPIDIEHREKYEEAWTNFLAWQRIEEETGNPNSMKTLTKFGKAVKLAAELKMPAVFEWVDNFLEGTDSKLVLFAHHKAIIKKLYKRYKEISVVITGTTPQNKRREANKRFQTSKEVRLFIGNIKAAGVGIDLWAANSMAFVETRYVPGDVIQCEDRLHRLGQKKHVFCYYLVAKDTVEEKLCKTQQEKQKVVTKTLDGKQASCKTKLNIHSQLKKMKKEE